MSLSTLADGLGSDGYRMLGYMALGVVLLVVVAFAALVTWIVRRVNRKRTPPPPKT